MRPSFASPLHDLREGMERWEAPGRQWAPSEAGLTYPPRTARHRARPRLGAAPPALHQPPGHQQFRGAPVRPAFALSAQRIASRKRPLIGQDTSRISEVWGTGIRNAKIFFVSAIIGLCPGRSAARSTSRSGALQSRGPGYLLAVRRNRGPGSAKQREERCIAPGTR